MTTPQQPSPTTPRPAAPTTAATTAAPAASKKKWKITNCGAMNNRGQFGQVIEESHPQFKTWKETGEIALS